MTISSRTPEGAPNRCPVCRERIRIEPSSETHDAPCPCCGHLLWFPSEDRIEAVFSSGEAAKLCKVSQQTIIRCFDSGQLKGYRVARRRRIPQENLRAFMIEHNIPTDTLDAALS
jgi:excisionase family DNA binding protein